MKKYISLLAVSVIATISVCAQNRLMAIGTLGTVNESPADTKDLISIKALHDFNKTYKTVTNEDWYIIQKGFMAKFTQQGIQHRIIYNKNGKWVATFRYYNEDQLPAEVRHLVKSTWYDAAIRQVSEVSFGGKTAYLVSIEDNTSLKTIKVVNNEMELFQEMVKL
ncbi:hypothetical protein A3860_21335 [Niastella vici]|uniref:Uncharacterized protein n=1 Tax=Niastella vici TaxID=1703345 RepID=A0A1V9G0B6_9BACT|nr:hypothetical protein [Niastella vici]OQP63968.1 hypothetical protein A3860_21335 [Niastella vici]